MFNPIIRLTKILDGIVPGVSRSLSWEFFIVALSFPASILLNRVLGAEDRGLLAAVVLIPSTVFALGSCQWDRLVGGLITSKIISGKEAWRRTIYYAYWLSVIFLPVGILSCLLYTALPLSLRFLSVIYCVLFPIYFIVACLASIYTAVGSIDGRYAMRGSLSVSYLLVLFLLLLLNKLSVESVIYSYLIMYAVCLVVGLSKRDNLLHGEVATERPTLHPLIRSFFPYALETFSAKLDIWSFSLFGTLLTLGQYTGMSAMMLPVAILSQALATSSTARLDWTQPTLVRQYLLKTVITFLVLLAVLILGGISVGPYLLSWLLGNSFQDGEWMIPWIVSVVVSSSIATQFHTSLQLSGLQDIYLGIQMTEPVMRLILVLVLGYLFSELGVMVGMTIASGLKATTCFWFHYKSNVKVDLVMRR